MLEIVFSIIDGLITFGLLKIDERVYSPRMRFRSTRIFWDFLNTDVSMIISAHYRKIAELMTPFVPLGDLQAYAPITRFFSRRTHGYFLRNNVYDTVQVLGSEEHWEHHKGKNLVIIGGPFYNKALNMILIDVYNHLTNKSKDQILNPVGF